MLENLSSRRHNSAPGRPLQGRRALDMAEGILIGLRRCAPEAAFDELAEAARRHRIPIFRMASALIDLATGDHHGAGAAAHAAAREEWHQLLDGSS